MRVQLVGRPVIDPYAGFHACAYDYGLRKIPTASFEANGLYLEVIRLAYNLGTIFQRMYLPRGMAELDLEQSTPQAILAAWRTHPPRQPTYSVVSQLAHPPSMDRENTASSS